MIRRTTLSVLALAAVLAASIPARAQEQNRIRFNDQDLFLSGSNVAWINFGSDIGPGPTDLARFEEMFRQLHESGGNAMRLWLHTTGAVTPEWDDNEVVGPGEGTIEDLEAILDLAWQYEIGMQLCLWSFDMLRISNGPTVTDRAYALLTDSVITQSYVENALTPMVEALEGHPAIIAWEIFNEAEGMTHEYGWDFNRHVPIAAIQRFVNVTAGAIHRADTSAQVTNGAWSFHVLWDGSPAKRWEQEAEVSAADVQRARAVLSAKYRHDLTADDVAAHISTLSSAADQNFYSDDALIAAGGDPDGTLDFYNVHYYEWAGTTLSPFHHDASYWGLDKPLVVGEFFLGGGDDPDPDAAYGLPWEDMYETLFDRGYAGAMGWQWFNYPFSAEGVVNWPRILENTEALWEEHRDAVDIDPGFRVHYFEADPPGIEAGQSSELSWSVAGASTVALDGTPVEATGTATVSPLTTTVYSLVAESADGHADTASVTVEVLDPEEVNRARAKAAAASSEETCCGMLLAPGYAFDGDMNTRWSSEWQDGYADEDPDDEWIYVDLGAAYDIRRIVLAWEAAHAVSYEIDVSYDAYNWTTLHEEPSADGGTDEIVFDDPPTGRYVRMQGIERATEWGYSLWEFEIYGLPSSRQPPSAVVTAPAEGAVVAPGASLMLRAEATDPDGSVEQVDFYADGVLLASAGAGPFEATWENLTQGAHTFHTVVTDNDGIVVQSEPHEVFAFAPSDLIRLEAEEADYSGDISRQTSTAASGRSYLDMRNTGTITFADIAAPEAGEYLITFGYNLFYDVPKAQYLVVNGDALREVNFTGATQTWLERGVRVPLQGGSNTIAIEQYWGWMYFDYMGVAAEPLNVATDPPADLPSAIMLEHNYPNPFNPATIIAYSLPATEHVRLSVFDVAGRRVATLVDAPRPAGTHEVRFDAADLPSGVYFYRLEAGSFVQTLTMMLVR